MKNTIPFARREPPSLKGTIKISWQAADTDATDIKQRSVRSLSKELIGWHSLKKSRESVEATITMFDSLRHGMLQLDEENTGKRADLKTSVLMKHNNLRINGMRMIGPVLGVGIGDIFFYWMEMYILGLRAPTMAGIDYLPATNVWKDESLAVSIISSGGYENDEDDTNTLVYTGQGGNTRYKEKLERGNLARMNSAKKKNQIRVVRGAGDPFINSGKVYIYDGIYHIDDYWMGRAANGISGFQEQAEEGAGAT